MQMEAACIDLLCQFESMLTHSIHERLHGHLGEIVAIVDRSLRLAAEFGQAHFVGKPLAVMEKQILEARECSQSLANAISTFEWKGLRRIIGRESASELDVLRNHGELGAAVSMVIVSTLGPAIELLGTESKSGAEMLRIVRLLIAELKEKW